MKKYLFFFLMALASGLIFLSACSSSSKTGNKHVKISLQLSSPQTASTAIGIIKERLIAYGIPEENISIVIKDNMIDVDVVHADNGERIVYLATTTGKLEFWKTYDNKEAYNFLVEANKKLLELFNSTDSLYIIGNDTFNKPVAKGRVIINAKKDSSKRSFTESVKEGREIQTKEQKESFAEFRKENPLFAYLQPNTVQMDGKQTLGPGALVGIVSIKDTMIVNYLLRICTEKKFFPRNLKLLWMNKPRSSETPVLDLIAIKVSSRDGMPILDGSVITEAKHNYSQGGTNEINMTMNNEGAKKWKRITAENVGLSIAMVLDNYVYAYPTVQSEIPNGRSSITGNFTKEEAEDMATLLKFHPMPAVKVVKVSITDEPK